MPKKSTVRLHGEAGILAVGQHIPRSRLIFVDRSKSGHRVKFSFLTLNLQQRLRMQAMIQALNPGKKVRVWQQPAKHHQGYHGLCVKIYE